MTDADHAAVLRRYMGGKRFTKAEAAAIVRAIELLEREARPVGVTVPTLSEHLAKCRAWGDWV